MLWTEGMTMVEEWDTVQEECPIMTTGGIRTVPVHTEMDTEVHMVEEWDTTVVTTTMDMVEEWDTIVGITMVDMEGMLLDMI